MTKLDHGLLVLAYNKVSENWGPRTPLNLIVSEDNGNTWGNEFILENEAGEYSYPAIVSKGNDIFLTYTWKRQKIAFWKMTLE